MEPLEDLVSRARVTAFKRQVLQVGAIRREFLEVRFQEVEAVAVEDVEIAIEEFARDFFRLPVAGVTGILEQTSGDDCNVGFVAAG